MNNAVTRKLLLLAVLLHAAFSSPADVKLCSASLFADSWIVILGRYGIIWVDGYQGTLKQLNKLLDDRLSNQTVKSDFLRWDTTKLFYTANYSHVLVTGFGFTKYDSVITQEIASFNIDVLDSADIRNTSGNSGFRRFGDPSDSYKRTCWLNDKYFFDKAPNKRAWYGYWHMGEGDEGLGAKKADWQKICDIRTLAFIPNENRFVFDDNKTMPLEIFGEHPTGQGVEFPGKCKEKIPDKFRTRYHDLFAPKNCRDNMPKDVPYDMVTDFNNQVKRNKYGNLHYERERQDHSAHDFFFNQLESGKFKLHTELFTDHNRIDWYYHILTRLSPYEVMKEMDKCYIRKFKKKKGNDKFSKKDQPSEFPRMLLIPKSAGPEGVPIPRLTTPAPEVENLFYPTVPAEMFANVTMFNSTVLPELFANVTIAAAPTPTPESGSAPITTASLLLLAAVFTADY